MRRGTHSVAGRWNRAGMGVLPKGAAASEHTARMCHKISISNKGMVLGCLDRWASFGHGGEGQPAGGREQVITTARRGTENMFTWMGLIAKFIEFVVNKLSSKTIDFGLDQISLDKKSQAAKAFYDLYKSLSPLEEVVGKAIRNVDIFFTNHKLQQFIRQMISLAPEVQNASDSFTKSLMKVYSCLEFYDNKLYSMFGYIVTSKGMFLLMPILVLNYNLFHIKSKTQKRLDEILNSDNRELLSAIKSKIEQRKNFDGIIYTTLGEKMLSLNFDDLYRNAELITSGEIPESKFEIANLLKNDVIEHIFREGDPEKAQEFVYYLKMHHKNINDAREALRTFIASNFSIEDLLRITR
jgi:hypothetical protein